MATNEKKEQKIVKYDLPEGWTGEEKICIEPIPFEAFGKTTRIRSDELARNIKAAFSTTFHDLIGVNIGLAPNGTIFTEFYFENNIKSVPEGKIKSVENVTTTNTKTNLFEMQRAINNKFAGKVYTLNNETRLLLSRFMYGGEKANSPDNAGRWDNEKSGILTQVKINDTVHFRGERILLRVCGLDTRKLVQALYGNRIVTKTISDNNDPNAEINVTSENARYELRYIKTINNDNSGAFIINIEQFDIDQVNEIIAKENPVMQNAGYGIRFYY